MASVLGSNFSNQETFHSYFPNKKMLLIFDNFDIIINNKIKIQDLNLIFEYISKNNIPCIIVTKKRIEPSEIFYNDIKMDFYKIDSLSYYET